MTSALGRAGIGSTRGRLLLAATSAAQLAFGVAGLRRALRDRTTYDLGLLRGDPENLGRDQWTMGTNLSAPNPMLIAQAAATALLVADRFVPVARRTLGVLGAVMTVGYPAERTVREAWRDRTSLAPLTAGAVSLAALMALLGLGSGRDARGRRPEGPRAGLRRP